MGISSALGSSALLPAGLGFRNVLINGNMNIDQRNNGSASTASGYTLDRWTCFRTSTNGGTFSTQRVADAPVGFTHSLKASNVTNSTANAVWIYQQLIEGFNVQNFALGSASPKSISLSFWVKSTTTGTYAGCLSNGSNRSYVFNYSITASNTWEYKTIYLVGDNAGTWAKDSTVGLKVLFSIGTGGNIGTLNTWSDGDLVKTSGATGLDNVSSASWQITGVQLEQNYQPTPFEQRPIGVELALCQRYYWRFVADTTYGRFGQGEIVSTTVLNPVIQNPVIMRASPHTIDQTGTASNYAVYSTVVVTACSSALVLNAFSNRYATNLEVTVASGLTAGRCGQLMANNLATAYIGISAEL